MATKARRSLHSLEFGGNERIMGKSKGSGSHTTKLQKLFMVRWLSNPANFSVIIGKTGRRAGFGGARTKISGLSEMAEFVYTPCPQEFTWKGEEVPVVYTAKRDAIVCQSRFNSFLKTYKTVNAQLDTQTGFGLTAVQSTAGMAIEEVVEQACPYFYQLDKLFGERQNIRPHSAMDSMMLDEASGKA